MTAASLSTLLWSEVAMRQASETIYWMQERAMWGAQSVASASNLCQGAVFSLTFRNDGMIYTAQSAFVPSLSIEIEASHLSSRIKDQIKHMERRLKQL